ncbi:MAG TPA: hypothetical protein VGC39_03360 [Candidatus Methylacidiphilales bacterium]
MAQPSTGSSLVDRLAGANQWDDEYAPRFLTLAPFDEKSTDTAFKAYADEFPDGKYRHAVLALRADADLIQKHWGDALDHLTALLSQQTSPELREGAVSELTYVFDQLDKDQPREQVLTEIMKRPAVRTDLAAYISYGGLPMLKDYSLPSPSSRSSSQSSGTAVCRNRRLPAQMPRGG